MKKKLLIALLIFLGVILLVAAGMTVGILAGWIENPFADEEVVGGPEGFLRVPDTGNEPVFAMPLDDGSPAEVRFDPYTSVPSWVSGPVPAPAAASRQESAILYFEQNKNLYRMDKPAEELTATEVEVDAAGMNHVHIDQVYKGVPVFGSDLKVHFSADGKSITAVNGRYYPGIDLDVEPQITAEVAIAKAKEDLGIDSAEIPEAEPEALVVLTPVGREPALTWKVVLTADEPVTRMVYFVDAHQLTIVEKYSDLKAASPFELYNAREKDIKNLSQTEKLLLHDGKYDDPEAQAAYSNLTKTDQYFQNTHNRNGFDNKGSTMYVVVHYRKDHSNAYSSNDLLLFGDGNKKTTRSYAHSLDIVAHEFTHSITAKEANLIYLNQSGALNESYSDVFGAMVDRDDWLHGEEICMGGVRLHMLFGMPLSGSCLTNGSNQPANRSLEAPKEYGQPSHMSGFVDNLLTSGIDDGGVHVNSGIPNKAAFNVASSIGKEKTEQIWYRALTVYLTETSQFTDARDASVQAAKDLYPNDPSVAQAVSKGFADVGIGGSGRVLASAQVEIDHENGDELYITVGVGNDPDRPVASTMPGVSEGGEPKKGFHQTIDISDMSNHLPPGDKDQWFLKVEDKNDNGKTGKITKFKIYTQDGAYEAEDLPMDIGDNSAVVSFIPSKKSTTRDTTPVKQVEAGGQSDTVLVMDVSGSMSDYIGSGTKLDAAKSGANRIISMVRNENVAQGGSHRLSLVSFHNTGQIEYDLGSRYDSLESAISNMSPQLGTNIGDGLQKGVSVVISSQTTRERIIFLLSDGQSNTGMSNEEILSGPVETARKAGIKIYTIGFGESSQLDEELLREIASQTGGEYFLTSSGYALDNIYINMRHKVSGEVVASMAGEASGTAVEAGNFNIDVSKGELHGTINWEEGKPSMKLIDPEGREVDSGYPGAVIFEDARPAYVVVKNPLPGNWKAMVESEEGGGTYDIVVSAQEGSRRLEEYPIALVVATGASLLVGLAAFAIFRWPIRPGRKTEDQAPPACLG